MAVAAPVAQSPHLPVRQDGLDRRRAEILDPALPIVDPRHPLWQRPEVGRRLLPELLADLALGAPVGAGLQALTAAGGGCFRGIRCITAAHADDALGNAFKRIAAGCSAGGKQALFAGTAAKFYRLG